MLEQFTDTLRQSLDIAQLEARRLNQEFVGSEHLLLGLLACDTCTASRIIEQHVDRQRLHDSLLAAMPKGDEEPVITGKLPLSPKSQRLINEAIVKARALRQQRISTRFLLLAILDEPNTVARQCFRDAGADVEQLIRTLAQHREENEE
jgi:ATP-dependent Clp protease ATP-binding subunit ClpC